MAYQAKTVERLPTPMLRETSYEHASSWLMALVAGVGVTVLLLSVAWFANRLPAQPRAVPVELVELSGGVEDGAIDETLRIESPAPEAADATLAEVASDEREVRESLDRVLELASDAAEQAEQQTEQGTQNTGVAGSARGTGRRALGAGPGSGGFPRDQRWFVRFGDEASAEEYARQLDYFGIELGALAGGKLHYVSRLSSPQPAVRTADSGAGENRLYMTWQGGARRKVDALLLARAHVNLGAGTIFHFYPPATENRLAELELSYRGRRAQEIRRTYFSVKAAGAGYDFEVVRQTYLK